MVGTSVLKELTIKNWITTKEQILACREKNIWYIWEQKEMTVEQIHLQQSKHYNRDITNTNHSRFLFFSDCLLSKMIHLKNKMLMTEDKWQQIINHMKTTEFQNIILSQ